MTTQDFRGRFPDEVVTHAYVRYVQAPGGLDSEGDIALVTLDNGHDHSKPSTFGPQGLTELDAALDEVFARSPKVRAVAVTGKPFIFAVGADITGVPALTSADEARAIGELGHRVFRRLRDSEIPTFAFVNGAAMGGGLEIALQCHYRTVSESAAAIALPECFLGLVPGWGGTQLLPNLIGADGAVKVILENALNQNKMLKPAEALGMGIFDVAFEAADFLERSLLWAAAVVRGEIVVARPEVDRGEAWDSALARGRAIVDGKLHGAAPAPLKALELLELAKTASLTEGFAAEDRALSELIMGEELRAGLYSFDLVQKRARRPVGVPDSSLARPVTKVGIVGAGLMASQLALLFVRRLEVPVVLTDLDQERVDKGVGYVHGELDKLVAKGRLPAGKAARYKGQVTGVVDKSAAFADADFVIEAVFEDLKVKKQVFADLEGIVPETCVLATNTSSLSVTAMAADLAHPERVVGFHFFNPVAVLPLLEIARAEKTDDATLATAFAVGKQLRKSCVLVSDAPAFVVNRLLTRFLGEVLRAVEEGTDFAEADHALDPLGLPMSPLVLLQLVGPAVALHVAETLHEAYPDRFGVSEKMRAVVEAGKTSFYVWDTGKPEIDPRVAEVYGPRGGGPSGDELRERALAALAEEIRLMLDDGVVAEPADIDLCMILGAGWPFHLGGITPYLDRTGIAEKVTGQRFQPRGVAGL